MDTFEIGMYLSDWQVVVLLAMAILILLLIYIIMEEVTFRFNWIISWSAAMSMFVLLFLLTVSLVLRILRSI